MFLLSAAASEALWEHITTSSKICRLFLLRLSCNHYSHPSAQHCDCLAIRILRTADQGVGAALCLHTCTQSPVENLESQLQRQKDCSCFLTSEPAERAERKHMDRLFFNVGLSASLLLSTHPRFASHQAAIWWLCLCGWRAKASCTLWAAAGLLPTCFPPTRGCTVLTPGCISPIELEKSGHFSASR